MKARKISVVQLVIFTALVYTATIVIQIYQVATGGYFNLGETMIYLAALVSTPLVAGVAGGVGAALADYTTGYAIFAPGTLVIKFAEGYLAGLLIGKMRGKWAGALSSVVGGLYAALFAYIFYSVETIDIGTPISHLGTVQVTPPLWIAVSIVVGGSIFYVLHRRITSFGEVVALLFSGSIMVLGYFLYEFFISNPILLNRDPWLAIFEIPVNIGQVVVGTSIALPVYGWLKKAGFIEENQ